MVKSYNKIINIIKNFDFFLQKNRPRILLIPPVNIDYKKAGEIRNYPEDTLKKIDKIFDILSIKNNFKLIDLRRNIETGDDGLHINKQNHKILSKIVYDIIQEILC